MIIRHLTFAGFVPDKISPDCAAAMDPCVDAWEPGPYSKARASSKAGRIQLYLGDDSNHSPTMIPHGQPLAAQVEVSTLDTETRPAGRLRGRPERRTAVTPNRQGHAASCGVRWRWLERNGSSAQNLALQCEELEHQFGLNRLYRHQRYLHGGGRTGRIELSFLATRMAFAAIPACSRLGLEEL